MMSGTQASDRAVNNMTNTDRAVNELEGRIITMQGHGPRLTPLVSRLERVADKVSGSIPSSLHNDKERTESSETFNSRLAAAETEYDIAYAALEEVVNRLESLI